ncbi:MAG: efflux RND transporter permease subunit [Bacteroidota bacterium]
MSKLSTKLVFGLLVIVGAMLAPFLNFKLLPANFEPTIRIDYLWPNTPQAKVEREVTAVLEGVASSQEFVAKTYSVTYDERGEIFVDLQSGTDLDHARYRIANLVRQAAATLPEGVQYPTVQLRSVEEDETMLLYFAISGGADPTELKAFFDSELHVRIAQLKGVENVQLGGLPRQFLNLYYDYDQLQRFGIGPDELATQLTQHLHTRGMGRVLEHQQVEAGLFLVQHQAYQSIEQLRALLISLPDGGKQALGDLVDFQTTTENERNFFRVNGEQTINFSVTAHKSANHLRIAAKVKDLVSELDQGRADLAITLTYDATTYLKNELQQIGWRSGLSLLALLLITILVYRRWAPVLQLFLSLLTSLSIAIIVYKLLQIDIHLYSLLGLTVSVGFVIDNSIIAIDHYRANRNKKIILPLLAATLTTICPLLLLFSLEEEIRKNLNEFALVIAINLLSSLLVALFLLPALVKSKAKAKASAAQKQEVNSPSRMLTAYGWVIQRLSRFKVAFALLILYLLGSPHTFLPSALEYQNTAATLYNRAWSSDFYQDRLEPILDAHFGGVLALFANTTEGQSFLTPPTRTRVQVNVQTPAGSSIDYIDKICRQVEDQLKLLTTVDLYETTIHDRNNAQLKVYFKPEQEAGNAPLRVKGALEELATNITGADLFIIGVGKPYSNAISDAADAILVIKGYDQQMLREQVEAIRTDLQQHPKVGQILITSEPNWQIVRNAQLRADYLPGLHAPHRIMHTLLGQFSSREIGQHTIDEEQFTLRLQASELQTKDKYSFDHQQFAASDSTAFKADYAMQLKRGEQAGKIVKDNQQYQLVLQVGVNGTNALKDVIMEETLNKWQAQLPFGFSMYEDKPILERKADWRLMLSLLAALVLVFAVCAILFESLRDAWVVIWNIPVTFVPVLYVLALLDIGLDQGVFAGLILLIGLLINSVLLIIYEFRQQLKQQEQTQLEAYLRAFRHKILPVVITALSTVVSLLPFVVQSEQSFWYNFSITVILGLVFSTLAMILLLPVFLLNYKS